MANESNTSSGGIGFAGLLTVLFIGLKLTGYISWSWWWVLSPLWLPLVVVLGIMALALSGAGILMLIGVALEKRK
jgi:hypothetical protein